MAGGRIWGPGLTVVAQWVLDADWRNALSEFMNFGFLNPGDVRPSRRSVAVVGAGPSGLAAAGALAAMGHRVEVFDKLPKPGGLMVFAIPGERLPVQRIEAGVRDLERRFDVRFHLCTKIVGEVGPGQESGDGFSFNLRTLGGLAEDHDAVVICTGTWRSRPLGVPGQDLPGVYGGLDFLLPLRAGDYTNLRMDGPEVAGQRLVVVGGGNTAMDVARLALKRGAAEVTVVYRRTMDEAPCGRWEVEQLLAAGGRWVELAAPRRIVGRGRAEGLEILRCELGPPDESGRACPVPIQGQEVILEADIIVAAAGLEPTPLFVKRLGLERPGSVKACWLERTSMDGVFVAGDALHGPSKIGPAVYSGLRAARSLGDWLAGLEQEGQPSYLDRREARAEAGENPEADPRRHFPFFRLARLACRKPDCERAVGKRLYVDYAKCIGCETCEAACRTVHGSPRVRCETMADGISVPLYCRHCARPKCVQACPVGAIAKDETGAVMLDRLKCRDCRAMACVAACPFAAMFTTGLDALPVTKCDLCAERQLCGLEPACVAMCPTGAIAFVDAATEKALKTPASSAALKRVMAYIRSKKPTDTGG